MKKKLATLLLATTTLVTSIQTPVVVSAQNIDAQIQSAQQKVNQLSSQLSQAETLLNQITQDVQAAEQKSAELQRVMAESQEKVQTLNTEIEHLQVVIEKRTEKLKTQARAEQTGNHVENYLGVILNSKSVVEAFERFSAIAELVFAGSQAREQQVKDKEAVEVKKSEVETALVKQGEDAAVLSQLQNDLAVKRLEQESVVKQVAIEKTSAESDKQVLQQQKAEADRKLEEARKAEAARVAAVQQAKAAIVSPKAVRGTHQPGQATVVSTSPAVTKAEEVSKVPAVETKAPVATPAVAKAEAAKPAATPTVAPAAAPAATPTPAPASGKGAAILSAAMAQLGVMQDCTMLVTNALRAVGINFHDWPAGYLSLGTVVPASQAQPGDIVYYANGGMGLAHIGVYAGNGKAVHGGWNGNQTVVATAYVGSGPVFIRVR